MYILAVLADVVEIKPSQFAIPSERLIEDWVNEKYCDKIIPNVGLCVGMHSLIKHSDGLISHGDGLVSINVEFRLIVFRPFKGEIILATITGSDPQDGIFLSTEFFDDIQVPPSLLPTNTVFDAEQNVFIWKYQDETDPEQAPTEYFFDQAERCYIRIEDEFWNDVSRSDRDPNAVLVDEAEGEASRARKISKAPYSLRASMRETGTGPKIWWIDAPVDEAGNVEPDATAAAEG